MLLIHARKFDLHNVTETRTRAGAAAGPRSKDRWPGMTKGVVVMAMVVYHSFNDSTDYTLGCEYLPFLSRLLSFDHGISDLQIWTSRPASGSESRVYGASSSEFSGLCSLTRLNLATQLVRTPQRPVCVAWKGWRYLWDYSYEIYWDGRQPFILCGFFAFSLPIAYSFYWLAPLLVFTISCPPSSSFRDSNPCVGPYFALSRAMGSDYFNLVCLGSPDG